MNINSCIQSSNHCDKQDTKLFCFPKQLSCALLLQSYSLPLSLTPWSVLSHSSSVFLRVLFKWNHTIGILLRLVYLIQHNAFEIHPSYYINIYNAHCLVLLSIILFLWMPQNLLIHSLWNDNWIVSSFRQLIIGLLKHAGIAFCMKVSFHFPWTSI